MSRFETVVENANSDTFTGDSEVVAGQDMQIQFWQVVPGASVLLRETLRVICNRFLPNGCFRSLTFEKLN